MFEEVFAVKTRDAEKDRIPRRTRFCNETRRPVGGPRVKIALLDIDVMPVAFSSILAAKKHAVSHVM